MRVLPVKIFDGTTAVFLEDNNEAYFLINSEHPAFEGKTIERNIPNGIRALLDIEYRDISDGTKLLEDIKNSTRININSINQGSNWRYEIPMGRRIGWEGGMPGAGISVDAKHLVIVVKANTQDVVTAFPAIL